MSQQSKLMREYKRTHEYCSVEQKCEMWWCREMGLRNLIRWIKGNKLFKHKRKNPLEN